ncbi:MAG: hypothetical protein KF724_09725 [Phycisphaeraceae bacterium]|nr:hypothetical protein [Phycisphaeraceae bacterium]
MSTAPRLAIGRSTGRCAATGEALEAGSACVAVLRDGGDDGFERLDYSLAAWDRGARPSGDFYFWRTVVPHPDERRGIVIDDEVLDEMLDRLADDPRAERQAFRWLVALMLLRKRRLKHLRVEREDDREVWLLQRRGGGDDAPVLRVVNPHLSEEDLRVMAEQIGALVESDLA